VWCVRFPVVAVALDGSRLMLVMGRQKMWESECRPYLCIVAVKQAVSSCSDTGGLVSIPLYGCS
jgi:hypothetical protein